MIVKCAHPNIMAYNSNKDLKRQLQKYLDTNKESDLSLLVSKLLKHTNRILSNKYSNLINKPGLNNSIEDIVMERVSHFILELPSLLRKYGDKLDPLSYTLKIADLRVRDLTRGSRGKAIHISTSSWGEDVEFHKPDKIAKNNPFIITNKDLDKLSIDNNYSESLVDTILEGINPVNKKIIKAKLEGYTFKDLAKIFNLSENTVRSRYYRTLKSLSEKYKGSEKDLKLEYIRK